MTKRERQRCYYTLEQRCKHLKDDVLDDNGKVIVEGGKTVMLNLVRQGIHPFDAFEMILEQHADLVLPSMAAYLAKPEK